MRLVSLLLLVSAACGGDRPPQPLAPAPLQSVASDKTESEDGSLTFPPLTDSDKGLAEEDGVRRIGAHRKLPRPLPGVWTGDQDEGSVWRLRLRAPGAVALRLHFVDFHLPQGTLSVRGSDADAPPESEQRYQGSGPTGDGDFWSDLIEGDQVVVEYHLESADAEPSPLPFRIEEISHMWQSPLDAF